MTNIKKAVAWSSINRFFEVFIQLISLSVLAHFVNIDDFAIMGILVFFISVSNMLIDSGMGGALIAQRNVSAIDYNTLFSYNIIVSILLYVLICSCSQVIASFYGHSQLTELLIVTCLSLIINSIGIIQNVILSKELKFKELAIISILSGSISLVLSIIMAICGFGIWSLVAQSLSRSIIVVILQFFYNHFIPKFQFSRESFLSQWKFGYNILISNALRTIYENVFALIFPKLTSLKYSGYYAQANKIQHAPTSVMYGILNTAAFPILAKLDGQSNEFVVLAQKLNKNASFIAITLTMWIFLNSDSIIYILMGQKWMPASIILKTLSISGYFTVIYELNRNILKSLSLTKLIKQLESIKIVCGIISLALFYYLFSYDKIIHSIIFTSFICSFLSSYYISKSIPYSFISQIKDILRSVIKISISVVIVYLTSLHLDNHLLSLMICTSLYIVTIAIIDCFTNDSTLKELFAKKHEK